MENHNKGFLFQLGFVFLKIKRKCSSISLKIANPSHGFLRLAQLWKM